MNGYAPLVEGLFAIGVLGLIWKIGTDSTKKIEGITKSIFKRFDEHKEKNREDFVSKDVCKIVSKQMQIDIGEIKTDVKILLRKNGFKST